MKSFLLGAATPSAKILFVRRDGGLAESVTYWPLRWRHNERDGVSNHRHLDCLLNRLLRRRSNKTSRPRVTGLCENSLMTGEFPVQRPVTRKCFYLMMSSCKTTLKVWRCCVTTTTPMRIFPRFQLWAHKDATWFLWSGHTICISRHHFNMGHMGLGAQK